jgi:hypothetical protein
MNMQRSLSFFCGVSDTVQYLVHYRALVEDCDLAQYRTKVKTLSEIEPPLFWSKLASKACIVFDFTGDTVEND